MVVVSVLYPATAGAKFDHAYYDAHHVPLVWATLGDAGLKDFKVFKGVSGLDGGPAPFVLMAHLTFESADVMAAAMGSPRTAEAMADVAKFTDISPVIQISALS